MCFSPILGLEESPFLLPLTVEQKPEAGACSRRGLPPTVPHPDPAHTPALDSSMGLSPTETLSSPLSRRGRWAGETVAKQRRSPLLRRSIGSMGRLQGPACVFLAALLPFLEPQFLDQHTLSLARGGSQSWPSPAAGGPGMTLDAPLPSQQRASVCRFW